MLLGGLRFLIPVIKAAQQQGYYVITADYLPNNIAHKFSDEYCNVSIIDKDAVLSKAKELKIDGIMSFACDPGVISASYVQNKLSLPSFGPFEAVEILQNKDLFRNFLQRHGFNVPWSFSYSSIHDAWMDRDKFRYPLIVKPTDSAGSKGCLRVDCDEELMNAIQIAFKYSIKGRIIVEEFLVNRGLSSDSDSYTYDGNLKFVSFNAQYFDPSALNPYTPAAFSWPSTFTSDEENYLKNEIQRLVSLLKMKTCVFNIETRVSSSNKPYIMELSPRGGGNRLCEMLNYVTGVDLITAITKAMVGDEPDNIEQRHYNGHWAELILHAEKGGFFKGITINKSLPADIVENDVWVKPGDFVNGFGAANEAIGTMVLRFHNERRLQDVLSNTNQWIKVITQ